MLIKQTQRLTHREGTLEFILENSVTSIYEEDICFSICITLAIPFKPWMQIVPHYTLLGLLTCRWMYDLKTLPLSLWATSFNVPCHKIRCFYLDIAIQGFFFPKVLIWDSILSFIYWRLTTKEPPATALGLFIQSCIRTDVSGNNSIFPFGNEGRNPYLEVSQIKLPCCLSGKESVCQAGVLGSVPGLGRSPLEK